MKKLLLILLLVPVIVHAQGWNWARTTNCVTGLPTDLGMIAYDKYSSTPGLYVTFGFIGDSVCMSPYTVHNVHDSTQTIIAKYDTSGNVLWALGSRNGQCEPMNLTTDADGNLYILGELFTDSVSIGTHTIINPNYIVGGGVNKNHCFFIVKCDPLGNVLWTTCGGEVENWGGILVRGGIAVDAAKNIYVSASFDDSVLIVGTHTFLNSHKDSGDVFLIKYGPSGNYIWGKTFGGISQDLGEQLFIGKNNRLYLTGSFQSSSISFGSLTLTHNGANSWGSRNNVFIAELDTAGNAIWVKSPVGNATELGFTLDNDDNIYIGGRINDTALSFGSYSYSNLNLWWGAFLAKYDTSGAAQWAKFIYPVSSTPLSSGLANVIYALCTDPCNNIWVTGGLRPSPIGINGSSLFPTAPTGTDIMLFAGFNSSGSTLQCMSMKSGGDDNAGIVSDCHGNIYMAGDVGGTIAFGTDTIHSTGEQMFVAKYNTNLGCSTICGYGMPPDKYNDLSNEPIFSIYPNPTSKTLILSATNEITAVAISNLLGQILYRQQYKNVQKVEVDVPYLPAGVYLIKINDTEVRKFVKQ